MLNFFLGFTALTFAQATKKVDGYDLLIHIRRDVCIYTDGRSKWDQKDIHMFQRQSDIFGKRLVILGNGI